MYFIYSNASYSVTYVCGAALLENLTPPKKTTVLFHDVIKTTKKQLVFSFVMMHPANPRCSSALTGLENEEECVEEKKSDISGSSISILIICYLTVYEECNAKPVDCFQKPGAYITINCYRLKAIYQITHSFLWSAI